MGRVAVNGVDGEVSCIGCIVDWVGFGVTSEFAWHNL